MTDPGTDPRDFARGLRGRRRGFLAELWDFLRYSRRWWLLPILALLLLLGLLVFLSGAGLGPFIYTLL